MGFDVEHALGYPSVRRVMDSIFGVAQEPLSFVDALSGSMALFMFGFFCCVVLRQAYLRLRMRFWPKENAYIAYRNAMRKGIIVSPAAMAKRRAAKAANDAAAQRKNTHKRGKSATKKA
jgi:hypothetical protein